MMFGVDREPFFIRRARPADIRQVRTLIEPYVHRRILLGKEMVGLYEAVQEFDVAVTRQDLVIGCGALHVMWEDLAEVRTLAVDPHWLHRRVGHELLIGLLERARLLGLSRVFCLTFEVDFFAGHGFEPIDGIPVSPEVYTELVRSHDDGVAEFLDLARVKPNTLGNTRMIVQL